MYRVLEAVLLIIFTL